MESERSVDLLEADLAGALSEGLSAEVESVLADEALDVAGLSAAAGVLSEFAWVGVILVRHTLTSVLAFINNQ